MLQHSGCSINICYGKRESQSASQQGWMEVTSQLWVLPMLPSLLGGHFFLILADPYYICPSRLAHSPRWSFPWSPLCQSILLVPLEDYLFCVRWVTAMQGWSPTTLWKRLESKDRVIHLGTLAQVFVQRQHSLGIKYSIRVTIHLRIFRADNLFDLLWFSFKSLTWKIVPLEKQI